MLLLALRIRESKVDEFDFFFLDQAKNLSGCHGSILQLSVFLAAMPDITVLQEMCQLVGITKPLITTTIR